MHNDTLRVIDIIEGTSVDGPGLRTSIYFAGCEHHCPACHNPQTWDFNAGSNMPIDELIEIVIEADFNVTFTGGDPVYQARQLTKLAKRITDSGKTIWLYTGFTIEQLARMAEARELLQYVEAVVDGPFVESLRDTDLAFRGSSNQRIIREPLKFISELAK